VTSANDRDPSSALEAELWQCGLGRIAGVDEVGVGPLAGPVIAAAVVLPPHTELPGVRDSKLLSPKRRQSLQEQIRAVALDVGIGVAEVAEIDECNIYQATLRAMSRAVGALKSVPDHLLIDARRLEHCPIPQTPVIRGDRQVLSIAAASVVAKVFRDRLMVDLDARYPGYGFAKHAGYGTKAHLAALANLGPCPIHRRSFAPVRALLEPEP
jgi:ribonuclease HII